MQRRDVLLMVVSLAVVLGIQYVFDPSQTVHTGLAYLIGFIPGIFFFRWLRRELGSTLTLTGLVGLYERFLVNRMPGYVVENSFMTLLVTAALVIIVVLLLVSAVLVSGYAADLITGQRSLIS